MWILRALWAFFLDFVETIVVSAAIFVLVYLFLFQPHQVDGGSMLPSFQSGEYILTDKVTYRFRDPERGDVVVFNSPQDERLDFIKRIVALPGDSVMIENGYLVLNGTQQQENYINDPGKVAQGRYLREGNMITVPSGQYAVMGDNRLHSSDSREWGFVQKRSIVGRAFFRYWPFEVMGVLTTNETELEIGNVKGLLDNRE